MEDHFMNDLLAHLNIISRIAARENAVQTQKLIRKVIENIRYKTSREGQILMIKDELKAVSDMIEIYSLRFGDVLRFMANVDDACANYYIPHYTIMAFTENSIYHAFEDMEGTREIKLNVKRVQNAIAIAISDNGSGFDTAAIKNLTQIDKEGACNGAYGSIPNTVRRISQHFGTSDIVEIRSIKGKGTTIFLNIPTFNEEGQL